VFPQATTPPVIRSKWHTTYDKRKSKQCPSKFISATTESFSHTYQLTTAPTYRQLDQTLRQYYSTNVEKRDKCFHCQWPKTPWSTVGYNTKHSDNSHTKRSCLQTSQQQHWHTGTILQPILNSRDFINKPLQNVQLNSSLFAYMHKYIQAVVMMFNQRYGLAIVTFALCGSWCGPSLPMGPLIWLYIQ